MSKQLAGQRRFDAAYLALLGVLAAVFFLPLWSQKAVLYQEDISEWVVPILHWLHGRYQAGLSVAWAQGLMGGIPVADADQSFQLYPPTRLFLTVFPANLAMLMVLWSHTWWAACGVYALVRQQDLSPGAAFFAAVLGAFGGGMVFAQRWLTVFVGLSWVPWALLGLMLIQSARGPRSRGLGAALLAFAAGLGFIGGYPGITVYTLCLVGLLHLAWLAPGPGWRAVLQAWKAFALAALIGGLLLLVPVLATLRLAPQSVRGTALTAADAAAGTMSPASLAQVFLPHALGRSWDNSFLGMAWRFGSHEPHGMALYAGLLGSLMALFALLRSTRRHAPWFLAWGLLTLYALGRWTPAFELFARLPVLDHLRHPIKAALMGLFFLALPVAWAVDGLHSGSRRAWTGTMAGLAALLLGAAAVLSLGQGWLHALGERYIQAKVLGDGLHRFPAQYYLEKLDLWSAVLRWHLAVQGAWALAAALGLALVFWRRWPAGLVLGLLLFGELASNGVHYMPRTGPAYYGRKPDSVEFVQRREGLGRPPYRSLVWGWGDHLRASFPRGRKEGDAAGERAFLELPQRNLALIYGLDLYNAYSPTMLRRHEPINGWAEDSFAEADMAAQTRELLRRRRLWDLGGAKYVFSGVPLQAPGLRLLRSGSPMLYENLQALPLAYFAEAVSGGWTQARAEAALFDPRSPQSRMAKPALVETPAALGQAAGEVHWRSYDDALWDLDVGCGQGGGTLVLSRTFYEGLWRATVDGEPVPMWAANVSYCAIPVPQGAHRVRIELHDPIVGWGVWAFFLGLLLGLGLMVQGLWPLKEEEKGRV